MILGFMQKFPWTENKQPVPTNFREKILLGVDRYVIQDDTTGIQTVSGKSWKAKYVGQIAGIKPKLHTMRLDPHNRWKAGRKIEMVYRGAGYKILDHFNKGIPELEECVSVQDIRINFGPPDNHTNTAYELSRLCKISIGDGLFWIGYVLKNGENVCALRTDREKIEMLAHNDGFANSNDFFRWFKKDWSGFILHWTDLRY